MNVQVVYLPREANDWTVMRSIASVVHSKEFAPRVDDDKTVHRPINFKVKLNPSKAGGVGNDGSGTVTFPTHEAGSKFLRWIKDTPLKIQGKKVKFFRGGNPHVHVAATLDKTPYINPDLEEEHEQKLWHLSQKFRVNVLQFGIFFRPTYPSNEKEPLKPRAFSVEWERRYDVNSEAWLSFEYDHKLFRITVGLKLQDTLSSFDLTIPLQLGSEMTDTVGSNISIKFTSIQKIAVGYDGDPYVCFDTMTPPTIEETNFHRTLTGDSQQDGSKFRRRIQAIHPGHQVVAPYAHHLRLLLHNDASDVPLRFQKMCVEAGLAKSMIIRCEGPNKVEADRWGFFTPKRLYTLQNEFKDLPWPIAFQLESLLHNCLLHTQDLSSLLKQTQTLCKHHTERYVSALLRHYHEKLEVRSIRQSPTSCFEEVCKNFTVIDSKLPRGNFLCCHVTFTPTRMVIEGPYPTQSNRVIRMYEDYLDHFVRVDFRDEDRLQYRWDREVNGSTLIQERVGGILKNGFELAGRRFELLAYSSSALREHAVWGWVNSEFIRQTLGDFKSTQLLRQPSKYAARLALAFTATDPSVYIRSDEWEGDGVVSVDQQLDKNTEGIRMRLRKSMKKFSASNAGHAEIEIAQSFEHPIKCYLNRPLIMILEDLGVRLDSFVHLQQDAVAEVRTINDSSSQFRKVLDDHNQGRPYRLSHLLSKIEDLNLDLHQRVGRYLGFDTRFLRQTRQVAMMDALRDIKHDARIPVPESYLLVGVADEGPAYFDKHDKDDIYTLPDGHIFVCIQKSPDKEPEWLEGSCSISRSPVVHPGDVQRVRAIGKPPKGKLCLFAHMKNVVVLPSVGQLGAFSKYQSKAVDYPKQGIPVDIDNNRLPRTLIRCKPDWHAAEVVSPRHTDYYESSRALGVLYRSIVLDDFQPEPVSSTDDPHAPLTDPISMRLKDALKHHLTRCSRVNDLPPMFQRYVNELRYICATHVLSNTPGSRITEAEVVTGTILAKCSQKRWRKDRIYRMRLHASTLVRDVQRQLIEDLREASHQQLMEGLSFAWAAWEYSQQRIHTFGADSFGLIALGVIFDCKDKIGG
ncbi:hypothetical protein H0H93_011746, partial [Arthromyces matolae]